MSGRHRCCARRRQLAPIEGGQPRPARPRPKEQQGAQQGAQRARKRRASRPRPRRRNAAAGARPAPRAEAGPRRSTTPMDGIAAPVTGRRRRQTTEGSSIREEEGGGAAGGSWPAQAAAAHPTARLAPAPAPRARRAHQADEHIMTHLGRHHGGILDEDAAILAHF